MLHHVDNQIRRSSDEGSRVALLLDADTDPQQTRDKRFLLPLYRDGVVLDVLCCSLDGSRMRIDLLFIQLAVVFLPGLIWTQLAATYSMKERPKPIDFLVRAFIFGLLTYAVVFLGYGWFGREFSVPPVGDSQRFLNIDFADELLWSSAAAFLFSLVWIYGSTRRWMTRLLKLGGSGHNTWKGRHLGPDL